MLPSSTGLPDFWPRARNCQCGEVPSGVEPPYMYIQQCCVYTWMEIWLPFLLAFLTFLGQPVFDRREVMDFPFANTCFARPSTPFSTLSFPSPPFFRTFSLLGKPLPLLLIRGKERGVGRGGGRGGLPSPARPPIPPEAAVRKPFGAWRRGEGLGGKGTAGGRSG